MPITTSHAARCLGLGLLTLALTGCQTTGSGNVYKRHTELHPPANIEVTAEIGETLIERTEGVGAPSLSTSDLTVEHSGMTFFIRSVQHQISHTTNSGLLASYYAFDQMASQTENVRVATSTYNILFNPATGACSLNVTNMALVDRQGDLIENWAQDPDDADNSNASAGQTVINAAIWKRNQSVFAVNLPKDECQNRYKFADNANTLSQELIYLGRSGDVVSLKYREFYGTRIRSAFAADLTYDLSETQTIGYKGARIEVLDAGNQTIRYRVLKHINPM